MTEKTGKYRGKKEFDIVKSELIKAAQYKGTITYKDVALAMGIPLTGNFMSRETGEILGEISTDEVGRGRPMLSAVAVSVKGLPGEGFYSLAQDLNLLSKSAKEDEKLVFWEKTKKEVYETWKRDYSRIK